MRSSFLRLVVLAAAALMPALAGAAPAPAHVLDTIQQLQTLPRGNAFAPVTQRQAGAVSTPPATPRASCRPGSRPEPDIQGRLPKAEVDSGRADQGYWCNITQIGHSGSTGGFRVHRYIDRAGRECAYYDTALLFPTNLLSASGEPSGVAVLDMSDPTRPRRTTTLVTPAMQTPHESLNISIRRGVLAAVLGNPTQYPGFIDVYDLAEDCRFPKLRSTLFPGTPWGHESGMAPDGMTFYPSSPGSSLSAVDIANPSSPRTLVTTDFTSHGLTVSEDGRRGYFATLQGLAIADLTEVQERRPNPQIREISRLTWPTMSIPQNAIPVTIKGKPYVVEVDEYSVGEDGGFAAHGPRVGAARIIDVSDEKAPRVVSDLRLAVHQPEHRAAIASDHGAQSPVQGYAAHYCNVPRVVDPGIVACSMIASGLRVFDIRDPLNPKEIAYFYAPPSTISATGGPIIDEKSNWAMAQPAFAPERGEIWYSDGTSGFYTLRMDPAVWPFPSETTSDGCVDHRGLSSASVRSARGGRVRLAFTRSRSLPVTVDVFRVSSGRRVVPEQRVASFARRSSPVTWSGAPLRPGTYFARFRMVGAGGKTYDTRRVTFSRTSSGAVRERGSHSRRAACDLLRTVKLERPVFGGTTSTPLRLAYSLGRPADVIVTVQRAGRTVKRWRTAGVAAGRTQRLTLPSRGLARGGYRVRVQATAQDQQLAVTLSARRL